MTDLEMPDEARLQQAQDELDAHRATWRQSREKIKVLQDQIDRLRNEIFAISDSDGDAFVDALPRLIENLIVLKTAKLGDPAAAAALVKNELRAALA